MQDLYNRIEETNIFSIVYETYQNIWVSYSIEIYLPTNAFKTFPWRFGAWINLPLW